MPQQALRRWLLEGLLELVSYFKESSSSNNFLLLSPQKSNQEYLETISNHLGKT
jgi:hypothetical protein